MEPIKSCETCYNPCCQNIEGNKRECMRMGLSNWQPKPTTDKPSCETCADGKTCSFAKQHYDITLCHKPKPYEGCEGDDCTEQEKEFCGCKPVEDKSAESYEKAKILMCDHCNDCNAQVCGYCEAQIRLALAEGERRADKKWEKRANKEHNHLLGLPCPICRAEGRQRAIREAIEKIEEAIDWTEKQCVGGILEVEGAKHKVGSMFLYRQQVEDKLEELKQAIDKIGEGVK